MEISHNCDDCGVAMSLNANEFTNHHIGCSHYYDEMPPLVQPFIPDFDDDVPPDGFLFNLNPISIYRPIRDIHLSGPDP